jgi:anti-sigma B factor antagonist
MPPPEASKLMSCTSATLEVHTLDGRSGLRLVGELDLATAPLLRDALAGLETSDGLVLEVDELTFIDSSGCHALTSFLRQEPDGPRLVFVEPSPAVKRTLTLTGLVKHPRIEIRSSDD